MTDRQHFEECRARHILKSLQAKKNARAYWAGWKSKLVNNWGESEVENLVIEMNRQRRLSKCG